MRRPQISLHAPWSRGGSTSIAVEATSLAGVQPVVIPVPDRRKADKPSSDVDEKASPKRNRRASDAAGSKPKRVIKSRLVPYSLDESDGPASLSSSE